jgi:uncharacterized glyoxalase superfamily protein PhnB
MRHLTNTSNVNDAIPAVEKLYGMMAKGTMYGELDSEQHKEKTSKELAKARLSYKLQDLLNGDSFKNQVSCTFCALLITCFLSSM